jgi:kumamolisin
MLHLTINLNIRDKAGLEALLAAQNDPQAPEYHHYLTPAEFTARFGQPQANIDTIVHYLRSQGMQIGAVADNHLSIPVTGTVAQIAQAFATQLMDFALHGRAVYAPTTEPSVPATIAPYIQGITGLDNAGQVHPLQR